MSYTIESPFQYFPDPSKFGAIGLGQLYIGIVNGNPYLTPTHRQQAYIAVQGGADLAIPQPISLGAGGVPMYNGSPCTLKISSEYSVAVVDYLGAQVYYSPRNGEEITAFSDIDVIINDIELTRAKTVNTWADISSVLPTVAGQLFNLAQHTSGGLGGGTLMAFVGSVTDDGGTQKNCLGGFYLKRTDYECLTPEAFGAAGDGVSDDAPAIQRAINALSASGGGTLLFNRKCTYHLVSLQYYSGVAAGLTLYRNEWNFLVLKDNVHVLAAADVTLKAANGSVASNKDEGGTKGYSFFGSGIRKLYNVSIKGTFLFDGNGANNTVFPVNWSGAQAHATAYSFYLGVDDFTCSGCRFINFPGANVGIIEWPSKNVVLRDLEVFCVSDCIAGNTAIVDHSTFYTRCDGYLIDNCRVFQPTESTVSTPFECHGSGVIRDCLAFNTGSGGLSAAFLDGYSGIIRFENHRAYNVRSAFFLDYADNASMDVTVLNADVTLRGAKRLALGAISKSASAFTSNEPGTSYVATCNVHLHCVGGVFRQLSTIDWDNTDKDLNAFADMVRIKTVTVKGASVDGFQGALIRFGAIVPDASTEVRDVSMRNCGYSQERAFGHSAFTFLNSGLTDYAVTLKTLDIANVRCTNCLYATALLTPITVGGYLIAPERVACDWYSDTNITPHEGGSPLGDWHWNFHLILDNVNPDNTNLPSLADPIIGTITYTNPSAGEKLTLSKIKYVGKWYKEVEKWSPSPPTVAMKFGDNVADTYIIKGVASGTPLKYVCTVAGATLTTLGTWVAVGTVP